MASSRAIRQVSSFHGTGSSGMKLNCKPTPPQFV
jgi:hypothetical protein